MNSHTKKRGNKTLIQFSSVAQLYPTLCDPMIWSTPETLPFINSWSLLKLTSIKSVMPSNHLILCCPLLLPSIFPSITIFSNESVLHIRWPKYWSFNFSISPSNEYSVLISFRTDWLDPVQSKGLSRVFSNITVQKHQFFGAQLSLWSQLSHPYMTPGKTIALARWAFVGKVMALLFNMLSELVIAFLLMSKCLLISWLQSPFAVILESKKIKSLTVSIVFPHVCYEVTGPDAMILFFRTLSFKPAFSLSSFIFLKQLFSSSSLSAIRVVSSAYLRLLLFLLAILIPACASSSPAFHMMYSTYELNKPGDNM